MGLEELRAKRLARQAERAAKAAAERKAKHEEVMKANQERLAAYQARRRAALKANEDLPGFPTQRIPEPVANRAFAQRFLGTPSQTGEVPLDERRFNVMENARKRREERRATLAARRRARYGLG